MEENMKPGKWCSLNRLFGVLLVLAPVITHAGWARTYGGADADFGYSIQQTSDGDYIVVGNTKSFSSDSSAIPSYDLWLLKVDENGNTVWTRTYGGTGYANGYHIQETSDTGYIITGIIENQSYGDMDLWLLKTNSNGDTLWTRIYGMESLFDRGQYVYEMENGGYMVFGETSSFGAGEMDVWILRMDADGDTLWTRTYGGEEDDWLTCVQPTGQPIWTYCEMLVESWSPSLGGNQLVKIDTTGEIYSDHTIDGNLTYMQEAWGGGYVVTGWWSTAPDDPANVVLAKTDIWDPEQYEWIETWGEAGQVDKGICVEPIYNETSCYIVTGGWDCYGSTMGDVFLSKRVTFGGEGENWTRVYGGNESDGGVRVLQTDDGGYIVLGTTESFGAGKSDIWLIKIDSLGYIGVEEPITLETHPDWLVANPIGRTVTLRASEASLPLDLAVFDASGRQVDEIRLSSGTVQWGQGQPTGVYFIRQMSENPITHKVVLVR